MELKGHSKAVTSISLEPAGNRLVTGSLDYSTKLFDFGGMDARHKAFHSIEAHESHVSGRYALIFEFLFMPLMWHILHSACICRQS